MKSLINNVIDIITQPIEHEHIACPSALIKLPDKTGFAQDQTGSIVFASYSSGATVIKHREFILCTSSLGEHWFADRKQVWYRMD